MKVILVNGSPHERGCTDRALREVAAALESEGVQTEMLWIGRQPVSGCTGCGACRKLKKCVIDGDGVNDFIRKAQSADGFVFGSPVHYASAEDVEKDEEGLQTMRVLGYNLAWLLKCVALGKAQGVTPKGEEKIKTNFIR